ncbi:hypothetical protein [Acrocarpospora sp. B8E8]|uniref:hypothetical protein n=1 Tax=Acrocarpospora sp. B8E8 TaxID=3153572 RepID=UPI00325CAD33
MTDLAHPMFGWDNDADGLIIVTIDDPDGSTNPMNGRFRREFQALVQHLHAERGLISGVVITSAKATFSAGGDLDELAERYGERFAPPTSLVELAGNGGALR